MADDRVSAERTSDTTDVFFLDEQNVAEGVGEMPLGAVGMRWLLLDMARCQSLEELFDLVSRSFGSLPEVALVRLWLLEPSGPSCASCPCVGECVDQSRCLHLVASAGHSLDGTKSWDSTEGRFRRFPLGVRKVGIIASSGAPFHVRQVSPGMDWVSDPQWVQAEGIRSFLGQPIIHQKEVLGVFALFSRTEHGRYVLERLRLVADHLAIAIANARAFEELSRLKRRLEIENDYLRQAIDRSEARSGLVGDSPALARIREQIRLAAPTDAVVLITGESGTGKEVVATEIHRRSRVAEGPLVKVNCPSIPRELFESEFFGHAKGAFTGATGDRIGFFEAANNGTLFLDEIGELPLPLQSKLLRVLQESEYHRVGEERQRRIQTRIVAATNRDLERMVAQGRFREDLYYRLNVFPLEMPPLRERRTDIPLLARYFLEEYTRKTGRPDLRITPEQLRQLRQYEWPGNIRELQNFIRRAVITARGGAIDLHFMTVLGGAEPRPEKASAASGKGRILREAELVALSRDNIINALRACKGKIYGEGGAAALLDLRPTTLISRMARLGVDKSGWDDAASPARNA